MPSKSSKNSLCERFIADIKNLLKHYVNDSHKYWTRYLPLAQIALNSSYIRLIGTSPHFLLYGYVNRLPYELPDYISPFMNRPQDKKFVSDQVDVVVYWIEQIRHLAVTIWNRKRSRRWVKSTKKAKRREIKVGEYVSTLTVKKPHHSSKLVKKYDGHYVVFRITSPNYLKQYVIDNHRDRDVTSPLPRLL